MPVFKVQKNTNYTVMSNYHFKDMSISLKAKGLLSQMLSLPSEWNYTLAGLAAINKEGVDAIREAVRELERAGYLTRRRIKNEKGIFVDMEYTVYEFPHSNENPYSGEKSLTDPLLENPTLENPTLENPTLENPLLENPTLENPTLENPTLENPLLENPLLENPTELNKDILNKDISNKNILNKNISSSLGIKDNNDDEDINIKIYCEAASKYPEVIVSSVLNEIKKRDDLIHTISPSMFGQICENIIKYSKNIGNNPAYIKKCIDNFVAGRKTSLAKAEYKMQKDYDFKELEEKILSN